MSSISNINFQKGQMVIYVEEKKFIKIHTNNQKFQLDVFDIQSLTKVLFDGLNKTQQKNLIKFLRKEINQC